MSTHSFTFGRVSIRLELPDSVRAAMLPAYIRPFAGDLLPRVSALIRLAPLDQAPEHAVALPRRLGFHRALLQRDGEEVWNVFTHLPVGPARPDALPTRAVIPAFFAVLVDAGIVPIHASAVIHGDRVIVIPGRSGSGKSTTAAALAELGCDFFADDRLLAWMEDDRLLVTPSFELGNPFSRWVGRRPEEGHPPAARRTPAFGRSAEIGELVFPEIKVSAPSALGKLSAAEALARLATSCAVDWSFPSPPLDMGRPRGAAPTLSPLLVPARRLTLGASAGTVIAQILSK